MLRECDQVTCPGCGFPVGIWYFLNDTAYLMQHWTFRNRHGAAMVTTCPTAVGLRFIECSRSGKPLTHQELASSEKTTTLGSIPPLKP